MKTIPLIYWLLLGSLLTTPAEAKSPHSSPLLRAAQNADESAGVAEEESYSMPERLAAEIATILCEDPQYQRCSTESELRCVLEMGLIANRCAAGFGDTATTEGLAAALTGCLIDEHARLLNFDRQGLLECVAEDSAEE